MHGARFVLQGDGVAQWATPRGALTGLEVNPPFHQPHWLPEVSPTTHCSSLNFTLNLHPEPCNEAST